METHEHPERFIGPMLYSGEMKMLKGFSTIFISPDRLYVDDVKPRHQTVLKRYKIRSFRTMQAPLHKRRESSLWEQNG